MPYHLPKNTLRRYAKYSMLRGTRGKTKTRRGRGAHNLTLPVKTLGSGVSLARGLYARQNPYTYQYDRAHHNPMRWHMHQVRGAKDAPPRTRVARGRGSPPPAPQK